MLTWITPAGQYARVASEALGADVPLAGSYARTDANPQSFFDVIPAPIAGFYDPVAKRVIALKNILIAVLAEGSERQRQTARDMSDALSAQPGSARHPLTIRAAHHMVGMVHRAARARDVTS